MRFERIKPPKTKRTPVSKKKRFEIFKRDGFACQYCGAHPPNVVLEIDHVIAVADGGSNEEPNLITACFDCNRGKSNRPLSDIPRSLSDRADEIAEREAQIGGYEAAMRAHRARVEEEGMTVLARVLESFSKMEGIPTKDFISIKNFIIRLGLHEVLNSIDIAEVQGPRYYDKWFKYFCGVCWRKIRDSEGQA